MFKEIKMKKTLILVFTIAAGIATVNCKSIDKAQVAGGKEAIIVSNPVHWSPFGLFSATAEDCLDDLAKEGSTRVVNFYGQSKNSTFRPLSASTSVTEGCQAIGVK